MNTNEPSSATASDINLVSTFLSDFDTELLAPGYKVDTIVICASAVLHGAETIFRHLQDGSLIASNLVLCGGVGHSTRLIWDAVTRHPEYKVMGDAVQGKSEARVLELILNRFFDVAKIQASGCRLLVEDKSTNCGANARETRKALEAAEVATSNSSIMIVQDPTMALRTRASFQKVYDDVANPPTFISFPVFIPRVEVSTEKQVGADSNFAKAAAPRFDLSTSEVPKAQLWDMNRFLELIIGEIPRLRDDGNGYGPRGQDFIVHIDVLQDVEDAWTRLRNMFGTSR